MKDILKSIGWFVLVTGSIAVVAWIFDHPTRVRKACYQKMYNERMWETSTLERSELNNEMSRINLLEMQKADHWYKDCLREKGMAE
jgi:hypothetical protein